MKTKHLLTGLVLPALFAACTAEEIESSKGVMTQEDLSARPSVGNVVLNFGNVDSRAELGNTAFNAIKFNANEDAIGARIIDTYAAAGLKDANGNRVAWKDYTITDGFASSNYQYVYNGEGWETSALMVEGNYMFYYPYNAKNVARGPLEIVTPTLQTVKPNEEDGERNPIAELYASENPVFVGYKFIDAEEQGLVQNVDMQHIFAYPQITLVNDFITYNKNGRKVETDLTISKVVFKADNLVEKYTVDHTNFRKNLTPEFSYLAKKTDKKETVLIEAGNWTEAETLLKKANIASIAQASNKEVEITVEFEGGLELAYGEEYAFNVVLPAAVYAAEALEMTVYTEDGQMIGIVDGDAEAVKYFANNKKMTFAPGKRYATEEYNFPTTGAPSPKKTAGNSAVFELGAEGTEKLGLIDAVAPVAVINTIEEFEAFLDGINRNVEVLAEITKESERSAKANNFILAPALDEKGNELTYANLAVDEAFLALLDEYNYDGEISFVSTMVIKGAEKAADAEKEIAEFTLGNEDYSMSFAKAIVKEGYVTANEYTAIEGLTVAAGVVTIGNAEIVAATVEGGEVIVANKNFDPSVITAANKLNEAGTAVVSTGKVTLNYTGETAAAKVNGGNLVIGSNVTIKTAPVWTKGNVENNGKITANVEVVEDVTLTNNGKVTGTLNNAGTIIANANMVVASNTGKIVVGDKKVNLTVSAGTGKVDNTAAGKVTAPDAHNVYAIISSLNNNGVDANGDNVLAKYDAQSKIKRFIITGAWEVDEDVTNMKTLKNKEIEFAAGSSLYVHNVTLEMPAKVIVSADVNWSGRSATTSFVKLSSDGIQYTQKANSTVYNNLTVSELCVKDASNNITNAQAILLAQAAANGGNVTLTSDAELSSPLTVTKEVKINLNGKEIKSAETAIVADNGAKLTIEGNGKVTGGQGGNYNAVKAAVGSEVIIKNGTYFVGADASGDGNTTIYANGGKVTIEGGEFKSDKPYDGKYWVLNQKNTTPNLELITVKGGKFYNFNPAKPQTDDIESYLAEGYKVTVKNLYTNADDTNVVESTSGKKFAEIAYDANWSQNREYTVVAAQ